MMKKINEIEYEEENIETRIYGQRKPTILLFTDAADRESDFYRSVYKDENHFKVDSLDVKSYEIDISECPELAAEYHVGPANTTDPTLSAAPVLIVNLNTADGKNPESRRFDRYAGFPPVEYFVENYKKLHGGK